MTPIPMLQMRKLRQGVVNEFSQSPRSTKLAGLGFEPKHSGPRACIITTRSCCFRTTNCFLLRVHECSYTLLDIVMPIIIVTQEKKYKQTTPSVTLLENLRDKSAHPRFKASPSPFPCPHTLSTTHATPSTWNTFPLLSDFQLKLQHSALMLPSQGTLLR